MFDTTALLADLLIFSGVSALLGVLLGLLRLEAYRAQCRIDILLIGAYLGIGSMVCLIAFT